jgi:uncharacterized protein YprB with RNaseH-like and TPR domain
MRRVSLPFPPLSSGQEALAAISALVPDLASWDGETEQLCFFDLETTGLSGGAGTLAFLAAFGRFKREGGALNLSVEQYLLLDYPGEADFIEAILSQFQAKDAASQYIVSYNGKSFDSQILNNRCLMNGFKTPSYRHADLLYPARRLWKRLLPSCSQGTIESLVLGLDRSGDIPGAEAPDIWFHFLKTGETDALLGICEHNMRDIYGLARIFALFMAIAEDPFTAFSRYHYDMEHMALYWRSFMLHRGDEYSDICRHLLEDAAKRGGERAAIALAIDYEWRLQNPAAALEVVEALLSRPGLEAQSAEKIRLRQKRLLKKLGLFAIIAV